MRHQLSSGLAPLDEVMCGGLPSDAITLVAGAPGTGKTILAQHYVFHNATQQHPAFYCSTVSEPLDKLLRYGQSLDMFDASAVGTSVLYEDLGSVAAGPGRLDGVLARLDVLLTEHRPSLIVIDSFKALYPFATDAAAYRRFLHDLAGRLSARPIATFLLGEYSPDELGEAPEFAVADVILSLAAERRGYRTSRYLEVIKLRGGAYASGRHAYRITEAGIEVFPRIADPIDMSRYEQANERVSTGIKAVDDLIHDGYWPGSATLIAGPTGAGKTLMGLHFIFHGAAHGKPGILATLQESRAQLKRITSGYGWDIDAPGVHIHSRSSVGLLIDEWLHEVLAAADETGACRLVVDSLGDLSVAAGDELRFREYMSSFIQRCARKRISLLMTHEVPELFGLTRLSEFGISHLCDNVVLLQYLSEGDRFRRAITVLKARASAHQPIRHEFHITDRGIELADTAGLNL
ncbi:MAG TPA: ATPase domain-containing protein [Acidimicrobiales bacterium]|nr:ATPase domain-containing protein [Acidimicrobiales bacterium]